MNITATIQARMGSSRFPGKTLYEICGKPMLLWQVNRIKLSRLIDQVVVATSTSSKDDSIQKFCLENNIKCFRGSEDDVLQRVTSLLQEYNVDLHVECYGDSPLVDPQIIDEFIGAYLKEYDKRNYLSSALVTSYPPGQEVTVYDASLLIEANELASPADPMREHVGYNITRLLDNVVKKSLVAPAHFNYPDVYLEVDTYDDMEMVKSVISHFYSNSCEHFSLSEILSYIRQNPQLIELNNNVHRRWKDFRDEN